MVEPAADPGVIAFGILIIVTVVCGAAASFAPARNWRIFSAAAILFGMWVAAVFVRKYFSIFPSYVFFLDVFAAYLFFRLSKPELDANGNIVQRSDWASYLCILLIIVAIFELIDVLFRANFADKDLIAAAAGLVFVSITWGFLRGFGIVAASVFAGSLFALLGLGLDRIVFSITLNGMTVIACAIVIYFSLPSIRENFTALGRNFSVTKKNMKKETTEQKK